MSVDTSGIVVALMFIWGLIFWHLSDIKESLERVARALEESNRRERKRPAHSSTTDAQEDQ